MTRDEHLEWAKNRALEILNAGDNEGAFTSMLSDLSKHHELQNHPGMMIGAGMIFIPNWMSNTEEIRRWITGFN